MSLFPFLRQFFRKAALLLHLALSDALPDVIVEHNADCKDDVYDHHVDDDPTNYSATFWNHLRVSSEYQQVLHDQDDYLASESLA